MKTRLGDCQFQVNKKRGRVLLRPLSLHWGDLWPRPSSGAGGLGASGPGPGAAIRGAPARETTRG
jgi:hypothetical protein